MLLTGATIQEAAKSPEAIGRLMVDMAYSEGHELDGHCLYFERASNSFRLLKEFQTGFEEFITGGWVRVITPPHLYAKEQKDVQELIDVKDAICHGIYRGCMLIEFNIKTKTSKQPKGFA